MPKLEYFLVSESVSVDQLTNRTSLFNILEEVKANKFPAVIPQVVVTSAWNREIGDEDIDYQVKVRISLPGEEEPKNFPMNFKIESDRHRLFQGFEHLQIQQPGELKFEVFINDKYTASHTVSIQKDEQ